MLELLNGLAYHWWDWMGSMLWQATVLIVVVSLIDLLVRRWIWPQVRYALWLLVFVKLLLPPAWHLPTAITPALFTETRLHVAREWARVFPEPATRPEPTAAAPESGPAAAPAALARPAPPIGPIPQLYLMLVWLAGMALLVGVLVFRMVKLRRWHQRQEERSAIPPWFHQLLVKTGERLGLERLPAIVFSDEAVTPAVYGMFRPVLLLPRRYDRLSPEEAEHVLLHELCHLKRGDLWLHGLALLLQVVYWFNPLLLWAMKQLRHVREICCDQTLAARLPEGAEGYRRTLLATARELLTERVEPGMGLLGVFEEPFWLVARIRWLEKQTWRHRKAIMAATVAVVLFMGLLVMPMAMNPLEQPGFLAGLGDPRPASLQAERAPGDGGAATEAFYSFQVVREITYVLWLEAGSRVFTSDELWVAKDRAALVEKPRTCILDRAAGRFIFLNHRERTYLEAALPLDVDALLSPEVLRARRERRQTGRLEATGATGKVLGHTCREFKLYSWSAYDPDPESTDLNIVWTTSELPTDMALIDDLLMNRRTLLSLMSDELQREMRKRMPGMQLRVDYTAAHPVKGFPVRRRYLSETAEMGRKTVPAGLFAVPADYERRERLELADIR
jgi:beta-lactamase regulating signal transducer with metallopeptidase domain